MIHAVYHRQHHRVTVEGHAHSAEPGHDLVCAAVSILISSLAANAAHLEDGGQISRNPVLRLESGDAEVWVIPRSRFSSVVTLIFDAICTGFDLLAGKYPEYISFEIRG